MDDAFVNIPEDPRSFQSEIETVQAELAELNAVHNQRSKEALRIYVPQPFQEKFHACTAKECLMSKANRAGGSTAGMIEVARAVTGQDPHHKYPKKDGVAVVIGYGSGHFGRVFYKMLFLPGVFRIIRDADNGRWRTYRPWEPDKQIDGQFGDLHRKHEAEDAPPLIPNRFIKKISWISPARRIFDRVDFHNGWTLHGLNSEGEVTHAQGYSANLILIDEDIGKDEWFRESAMRLTDPPGSHMETGLLRWTAMPRDTTESMAQLIERAEQQEGEEKPSTIVIFAGMDENKYMSEESREQNKRILRSSGEAEYERRIHGRISKHHRMMYPSFGEANDVERAVDDDAAPLALKLLKANNYEPPPDWCNYFVFDPGFQVGAGGFYTVPPPRLGRWVIQFDELYIQQCTAPKMSERLKEKTKHRVFQEFIIDAHGGRLTDFGTGQRPRAQYEAQMRDRDIRCVAHGSFFRNGCDDIETRVTALRTALNIRPRGIVAGFPEFMMVMGRCPNSFRELRNMKRKTQLVNSERIVTDDAQRRGSVHTCECTEMAIAHGLPYVPPPQTEPVKTWYDELSGFEEYLESMAGVPSKSRNRNQGVLLAAGVEK